MCNNIENYLKGTWPIARHLFESLPRCFKSSVNLRGAAACPSSYARNGIFQLSRNARYPADGAHYYAPAAELGFPVTLPGAAKCVTRMGDRTAWRRGR